jgi:hypothetical protein
MDREEDLCMVKEQYAVAQQLYEKKIEALEVPRFEGESPLCTEIKIAEENGRTETQVQEAISSSGTGG